MKNDIKIISSSGNVFEDLGFSNAKEELAKASLTARISSIIQEKKLTQKDAAKLLGIDQPKISALKHGKYTGYSLDRLFSFLLRLGNDIDVTIRPKTHRGQADIHIHAAF